MKILIYGGNGWIGNQFISLFNKLNIKYINGNSRVDNEIELINEIEKEQPTHILCLIGRTHGKIGDKEYTTIDYLEQKGKLVENIRDNLYSPLILAIISERKKIHLTYLGTGCIFEYDNEHLNGFNEESKPNFFGSSYSVVKGYTDRLMHLYENNVLNLRIRMPINEENNKRNFITKITNYKKICSISNSMTVLPELIPIAIDMMKNKLTGTINLTNPGTISHNEILELYKNIVDPAFKWENFTIEEQNEILSAGRSNNYLDTTKLEKLYPEVKNIKESVKEILYKYPKPKEIYGIENNENTVLLVTGGCGFIGSNFINYIVPYYNKIKIINLDAMYYCANEENINKEIRESTNYILIKGNLCDKKLIEQILNKYNITHIIHFAAQSHVQNSFEDSLQYTYDNILGTHTLLEYSRRYGKIKRFIHVSTDEVYGESMISIDETHKNEHSVLCPTNPYAGTKAGAELIAQSYEHSFKFPIIITRGNNVYGINQYPEKLIPRFIKLLKENKKLTIQGNGNNKRNFLHVDDVVIAFRLILERGEIGEIYNIGGDEETEYSVLEIAKKIIKLIKNTDNYDEWIEYIEDRPFNDSRYYISNGKVKSLGWCININFDKGLESLIL